MTTPKQRLPAVDLLKALASQFIVLHHLAAYGPLSEAVQEAVPGLIGWFYDNARMAVQVFLVVGGYLTARNFLPGGRPYAGPHLAAVANRYLRLTLPFLAALVIVAVCAVFARQALDDDFVPDAPTLAQAMAHLLLLQGVLDYEALTVGAWYVAIDIQLFVTMILLSRLAAAGEGLGASSRRAMLAMAGVLMAASLFWFNRDAELDDWAIYFFGAYGLGAATCWVVQSRHAARGLALLAALALVALAVDFRGRLLVALAAALVLGLAARSDRIEGLAALPATHKLGAISYSLFLVHFPVLLLANAAFVELDLAGPLAGAVGMAAAWGLSILAAIVFHRWIERPANRLRVGRRSAPASRGPAVGVVQLQGR